MYHTSKIHKLGSLLIVLFFMTSLISCGGNAKKAAQAPPKELIENYIAKHEIMIDQSLADLYIEKEKKDILAQVNKNVDGKKQDGSLQSLKLATFDLSGLIINVVDQREEYVNDEIADFMKVTTSGDITMSVKDVTKKISINNVIILEKESGVWKVTEKNNPWAESNMFAKKKSV